MRVSSCLMRDFLLREGHKVGRLHVATLMKRMGIEAIYRRPNTIKSGAGAQDLPVPAPKAADHATEPDLGDGYYSA